MTRSRIARLVAVLAVLAAAGPAGAGTLLREPVGLAGPAIWLSSGAPGKELIAGLVTR